MGQRKPMFHIGMRNVKTSLAVLICLAIFVPMGRDASPACIAALIAMQGTLEESLAQGRNRLIGIGIGGLFGAAFSSLGLGVVDSFFKILISALGIMLVILICNVIYRQNATVMGCVTFLGIVLTNTSDMNPWFYSLGRIVDNSTGIIIAVAVNRLIRPPHKNAVVQGSGKTETTETASLQPQPEKEPACLPAGKETRQSKKTDGQPGPKPKSKKTKKKKASHKKNRKHTARKK